MQQALVELPTADSLSTEVQRLVRQRVGQDRYRQAMLDYWGGACAVTGLTLAPALRASHAKPWADCSTDAERLDVFNGFLLSANLDRHCRSCRFEWLAEKGDLPFASHQPEVWRFLNDLKARLDELQ